MGGYRRTREGDESLCIREFPRNNLILTHYMLITWWFHIIVGLGHYVIYLGEIDHVLVTTNNIMNLSYTYAKHTLKNPPGIFYKIAHTGQLMAWIPSRLAWDQSLWGRELSLLFTILPTPFYGTNNHEAPTTFNTSRRYKIWDSGCTRSINTYFVLNRL